MGTMKKVVIVSIVAVVVLLATGGYLAKRKYDSLLAATSQGISFGQGYGNMIAQSSCTLGLKVKYASCNTAECELSANGYIVGCMGAAKKDDFCASVPNIKNTDQALGWASKTCSENGLGSDKCLKYIHKFVSVCTAQTEGRTLSSKELFESGLEKGLKKK